MKLTRIAAHSILVLGLAGWAVAAPADDAVVANAAEQANAALVRTLIGDGADVNVRQVDGMSALHWAVYHDDADTAKLLIDAGANVKSENRYGIRPLWVAVTNGNGDIVTMLLEAGADPNATARGEQTVLMHAARTGSLEAVRALLARGADPNAREAREQTALMWAAAEGHAAIVHALLEIGAELDPRLRSGFTPLFFAVREGHTDVVHTLLEAGADVDDLLVRVKDGPDPTVNNATYRPVDDGISPLILAIRNGHFELAIDLVHAGADPNDLRSGFGALHTMSWVRKPDESDRGDPAPIGGWPEQPRLRPRDGDPRGRRQPAAGRRRAAPAELRLTHQLAWCHGVSAGRRPGRYHADAVAARAGCRPDDAQQRRHHATDGSGRSRYGGT